MIGAVSSNYWHTLLARLAARHGPGDKEINAMAGIYLELNGEASATKACQKSFGPQFQAVRRSNKLFGFEPSPTRTDQLLWRAEQKWTELN